MCRPTGRDYDEVAPCVDLVVNVGRQMDVPSGCLGEGMLHMCKHALSPGYSEGDALQLSE